MEETKQPTQCDNCSESVAGGYYEFIGILLQEVLKWFTLCPECLPTRRCTQCDIVKELTAENFKKNRCGYLWVCKMCKGKRVCAEPGCRRKQPRYGVHKRGELFCREHGKDLGMIDVKHRRCAEPGCKKQPCYNYEGETRGLYCKDHGEDLGMIDVVSCRCAEPGCVTIPCYNYEGETRGLYCKDHGEDLGMINVKNRRCEHADCSKGTWKGIPGNSATHCAEHSLPGMIAFPKSRCTFRDETNTKCQELALYGITRALHCETHKETNEINLVEQNCVDCGLLSVVDAQGVCGYCNPTNQARVHLAKQRTIQAFLDRRAETGDISEYDSYDRQLDSGVCGRERPDFLWDCGGWYVILEVDENQHSERVDECETVRMKNIAQSLGGPKVWFLRYNPDPYRTGGETLNPTEKSRHKTLLRNLKFCLENSPAETDFVTARYLYYNGYSKGSIVQTTVEYMAAGASAENC